MSDVQSTIGSPARSMTKASAARERKAAAIFGGFSAVDTVAVAILLFHSSLIVLLFAANIWYLFEGGHAGEFAALASNPDIRHAAVLTLWTSLLSSLLAVCFAIPISYALSRTLLPGRTILDTLIDTPIVLPNLVVGVVLLVFFRTFIGKFIQQGLGIRFIFAPADIVLAQFICVSPYAVRTIKSAFDGVDRRLEDVSRTLGWSSWQTFLRVTLPMVRNGIVAASADRRQYIRGRIRRAAASGTRYDSVALNLSIVDSTRSCSGVCRSGGNHRRKPKQDYATGLEAQRFTEYNCTGHIPAERLDRRTQGVHTNSKGVCEDFAC